MISLLATVVVLSMLRVFQGRAFRHCSCKGLAFGNDVNHRVYRESSLKETSSITFLVNYLIPFK